VEKYYFYLQLQKNHFYEKLTSFRLFMTTLKSINPYISKSVSKNRAQHVSHAISIGLPPTFAIAVVTYLSMTLMPTLLAFILTVLFFTLGSSGLALGYHRYFTHHAFKTSKTGKILLTLFGTWSLQGSVVSWVADHRRHHRFADQQYDPHSPYANDKGLIGNLIVGIFHAHIGWKFTSAVSEEKRYVPELLSDPVAMFFTRHYIVISFSGLFLPGLIGWFVGGLEEAASCFVWAGCIRAILIHQLAWAVSSFGHVFGEKIEGALDESRNSVFLGLILMGEGLHSYHHKNPTLAMNEPVKFDAFGHTLVFFERLGLVWNLRKAKPAPVMTTEVSAQDVLHSTGTI
jgi:stearoyl-CoA desaturase (Delta-9 desaturase)